MLGQPEAGRIPEKFIVLVIQEGGKLHKLIGVVDIQSLGVAGPARGLDIQRFQHLGRRGKVADHAGVRVGILGIKIQHGLAGSLMIYHAFCSGNAGFVDRIGSHQQYIGDFIRFLVSNGSLHS